MKINPSDKILGISVLKIRELLLHFKSSARNVYFVVDLLNISKNRAQKLIEYLKNENLIESEIYKNIEYWTTTLKGNSFALASAARSIKKKTAERLVNELLERINEINNNNYYLYKVSKVIVFGSYITEKTELNDIDIAVELNPKISDVNIQQKLNLNRSNESKEKGRKFNMIVDELFWAQTEVKLKLKNRSKSISLHGIEDEILKQCKHRILFKLWYNNMDN